jgi:hypothetical protein
MNKDDRLDTANRDFLLLRIIAKQQKEINFLKETLLERDWQIHKLYEVAQATNVISPLETETEKIA